MAPQKKREKKITCHHLTFALCKGRRSWGSPMPEKALCPVCPRRQQGFQRAESGSWASPPSRGLCPAAAPGTPGGWVLVEGTWCRGASSRVLSVRGGWVPGAAQGTRRRRGKGSPPCPGLIACPGQRSGGFSHRDPPRDGRAPSRGPATLCASLAAHGSSDEVRGSRPPRENSWE